MSVTGVSLTGFMFFVYALSLSQPTTFVKQKKIRAHFERRLGKGKNEK